MTFPVLPLYSAREKADSVSAQPSSLRQLPRRARCAQPTWKTQVMMEREEEGRTFSTIKKKEGATLGTSGHVVR